MVDSEGERLHGDGELLGGRYLIDELVGVGGTASVYAAQDLGGAGGDAAAAPRVALKLLHPHLCASETTRASFLKEAEHGARLRHPAIAAVHGWGLHDGGGISIAWIALDLVEGPTLAEWVAAFGPLAPWEAARVCSQVLDALEAAHSAGIVHRDLTPRNIVLRGAPPRGSGTGALATAALADAPAALTDGLRSGEITPTLLDFGLAATAGSSAQGDGGEIRGTVDFVSPEHAQGLPVRAAADLYQAGAVLYFALTGKPPFERASGAEIVRAHLTAPPPVPSALVPAAEPLNRVVTRAMTKTPARRFRDAAEFREALRDALPAHTEPPEKAAEPSPSGREGGDTRTLLLPAAAPPAASGVFSPVEHAAGSDIPELPPAAGRWSGLATGTAILLAVTMAALAVFAVSGAQGERARDPAPVVASPPPTSEPTTAAPVSEPPPSAPPAPPPLAEPITVPVPLLSGSLSEAEGQLRELGLLVGSVSRIESTLAADSVLSQHPAPGQALLPGEAVNLTLASGSNSVPQVASMTVAAAAEQLRAAGFTVAPLPAGVGDSDKTSGSLPAAGAVLRLGATVMLQVPRPVGPDPGPTDPAEESGGEDP